MSVTTGTRKSSTGFTLLEVLVAVVIFSIGLLGIATLHLTGMKQTFNSHVRAVAVAQAEDMADRMRANPSAVSAGDYNVSSIPGTAPAVDCSNAQCTAAQMAAYDLYSWAVEDAQALPQGAGVVCLDSTPDDGDATDWKCDDSGEVYAVKVQWSERGLDSKDNTVTTRRFVMRVKPW